MLVEKGADLYHKDEKDVSTLLQASHRGLVGVVEKLLAAHKAKGGSADYLNGSSEEGAYLEVRKESYNRSRKKADDPPMWR